MMITNLMTQLTTMLQLYLPVLLAGIGIGLFFFATLWITVHKGLQSTNPALWFLLGLLIRMSVSVSLFYWLGANDWQRLLACLLGFIIGRQWIKRLTHERVQVITKQAEISHAS
ncbi:ATP synthase subunit I [Alteromonadaceae bacterium BrNp21-10]|nr:ATP synthase subunit I [Alteromonadaceae bacterium BrNp21-10]